jgi:small subunit ribosomal protein S6e
MANFKIVISDPKARKAYQKEVDQGASGLIGKKIGDKLSGNHLGLSGYELEVTGGSDKEGFPMRRDMEGPGRKKILLSHGPGFHPKSRGRRKRKSIRGNSISPAISQVNAKVVTYGAKSMEELLGVKKEHKAEAPKTEKAHEKPAEKKEHAEKPKEEPKPAAEKPREDKAQEKPEHADKKPEPKEQKPQAEKKEEAPKAEKEHAEKPAEKAE